MREGGKDPTFVGLGYKSRAIIGKHPTGVLAVDDIHDENNTASARELDKVMRILTGTIYPTATPNTWQVFIGTPWSLNDVLAYTKSTGRYRCSKTPIYTDGEPTWPEMFPEEEIQNRRELSGAVEFARMFLLDVEAASGIHLKKEWLHEYPVHEIGARWPVVMGVDYASTGDKLLSGKRDYCCIAIGKYIPGGGVVLVDGFRGKVSQGEAEQRMGALAAMWEPLVVGVEAIGKGEEFYYLLLNKTTLPLMKYSSSKNKGRKFEKEMAPLFEFSRAWISSAETPFLKAFRDEWMQWPRGEHDDTLDAVYWMLRASEGNLAAGTFAAYGSPHRKKQKSKVGFQGWARQ